MRILVVSDSHGRKDKVEEVLKHEQYDMFVFLGDGLDDIESVADDKKTIAVRGNCDFFKRCDDTKIVEMAGLRFLITHGDRFYVKSTLSPLIVEAKLSKVDVVLYGHTHSYGDVVFDDIRLINCPSLKGEGGVSRYLLIDVEDKKISIRLQYFEKSVDNSY